MPHEETDDELVKRDAYLLSQLKGLPKNFADMSEGQLAKAREIVALRGKIRSELTSRKTKTENQS